jgi:hypothetical protein
MYSLYHVFSKFMQDFCNAHDIDFFLASWFNYKSVFTFS